MENKLLNKIKNMDPVSSPANQGNENGSGNETLENEVEFTAEEKAAMDAEISKKVATMAAQKAHWREKANRANQALEALKNSPPAPVAPVTTPVSAPTVDVETAARKVAMDIKRDEILAGLPEDKRGGVKEVFTALTQGKQLDVSNLNTYMETAMRAVGVTPQGNDAHRFISSSPGSIPPRTPPGPTKEQIEFARKAGNDPAKVYGKDLDVSRLAGAEKFFSSENKTN